MAEKKKPIFYDTRDLLTIRKYTHAGVDIYVRIDREQGKISLVERSSMGDWKAKNYKFAERGVTFMATWKKVLKAIELAVKDAEADLRAYQKSEAANGSRKS